MPWVAFARAPRGAVLSVTPSRPARGKDAEPLTVAGYKTEANAAFSDRRCPDGLLDLYTGRPSHCSGQYRRPAYVSLQSPRCISAAHPVLAVGSAGTYFFSWCPTGPSTRASDWQAVFSVRPHSDKQRIRLVVARTRRGTHMVGRDRSVLPSEVTVRSYSSFGWLKH